MQPPKTAENIHKKMLIAFQNKNVEIGKYAVLKKGAKLMKLVVH